MAEAHYGPPFFGGGGSGNDPAGGFAGPGSASNGRNGGFGSPFGIFGAGFNITTAEKIRLIHGTLAAIAFVGLFPLGAIFLRILPGRASLYLHVITQILGLGTEIAASGLGIYMVVTIKPFGQSLVSFLYAEPREGWRKTDRQREGDIVVDVVSRMLSRFSFVRYIYIFTLGLLTTTVKCS